jgi:hypothetical protein
MWLFEVPNFSAFVHYSYFGKKFSYFSGFVISCVLLVNARRMNQYVYYAPPDPVRNATLVLYNMA